MPTYKVVVILSLVVGMWGCAPSHQQETALVQGVVKLDGKPLAGGSIMFVPETGRGAVGAIDPEGRFVLGTYTANDGAIVGRHKIAVFPASTGFEVNELPDNYLPIPTRYQNGNSSGIEVDVKAGEENKVEVNLTQKSDAGELYTKKAPGSDHTP